MLRDADMLSRTNLAPPVGRRPAQRSVYAEAEADPPVPADLIEERLVGAMLPSQLLQSGEIIVLQIKPSPWFIVLDALGSLATLVAMAVAVGAMARFRLINMSNRDLLLAAVGLGILLRLFWQFLEWLSRVYVLTDRRVITVKGVLQVAVFEAALRHVQHTTMTFTIRERLFGLGTIGFATAGTAVTEAAWTMIGRPLDVNQIVIETLDRYR